MKSKMPKIGEAIFCIIYLIFGACAGCYMVANAKGSQLIFLYGILALVLAGGDAFHLVPRIIDAFKEKFKTYEFWAGLGLMISSITMTFFYIILYYICLLMKPEEVTIAPILGYALWFLAILRVALCLFPQNNWFAKEGNARWGILRNIPFVVVGLIMIYVCVVIGKIALAIAIVISFVCYLPVVLWAKKKPMIGMLMIPKTMAYMWMIGLGLML